ALTNLYQSNIRWNMPARLMVMALFGWAAGIIPAILDGTIRNNLVMHNTQWVPGHFHFYLLIGVLPMCLALMFHVMGRRSDEQAPPNSTADNLIGLAMLLVGGLTLAFSFLRGG